MKYRFQEIESLEGLQLVQPPHAGQVAAAQFLIKRIKEGKSEEKITPFLQWLADYPTMDPKDNPVTFKYPKGAPKTCSCECCAGRRRERA